MDKTKGKAKKLDPDKCPVSCGYNIWGDGGWCKLHQSKPEDLTFCGSGLNLSGE